MFRKDIFKKIERRFEKNPISTFGIIGALIAYLFIGASVAVSPWFNIYNNALSDLGNYNHSSAAIYDAGLILSGILIAIFAISLSLKFPYFKMLFWSIPLSASAVNLALIGVFTENYEPIHGILSTTFFALIDVSLFFYSYTSWLLATPRIGLIALLLGLASAIIWLVHWPWSGVAIQETSTSILTAIWLILISVRSPWVHLRERTTVITTLQK